MKKHDIVVNAAEDEQYGKLVEIGVENITANELNDIVKTLFDIELKSGSKRNKFDTLLNMLYQREYMKSFSTFANPSSLQESLQKTQRIYNQGVLNGIQEYRDICKEQGIEATLDCYEEWIRSRA